jgi:CBS domain-containing protein
MHATAEPFLSMTVADLMTRGVTTVAAGLPLRKAAQILVRSGVHGAPVVDEAGRCVGVLSVSDLARQAAGPADFRPLPRACSYQETRRDPAGREWVECQLRLGGCSLQRPGEDGVACADPRGICTDWQVVEVQSLPVDEVLHHMTTEVVTATPNQTVPEAARLMLDRAVHRVIVVDAGRRPVGVVSVTDVLRVVAGAGAGGSR